MTPVLQGESGMSGTSRFSFIAPKLPPPLTLRRDKPAFLPSPSGPYMFRRPLAFPASEGV